ncbi:MAG: amidohydrolase family protein [Acidobacteriota bacterium]|nr:amidohydrolase family protein [Acidobacteriota bacterium]
MKNVTLAALLVAATTGSAVAQVAVRAGTLHTVSGAPIENAVVIAGADGRIEWVGPAAEANIPDGVDVLEAAVVTPGLVDARSVVGLSGALNSNVGPVRDQDQLERSSPLQPDLRAIDAYDANETLVEWVRSYGVTTLHTGHGPGALVSGQTMIAKTRGRNVEQATLMPVRMLAATLGNAVSSNFQSPGTSAKGIAMLRSALHGARAYLDQVRKAEEAGSAGNGESNGDGNDEEDVDAKPAPQPPPRDLSKEALGQVLDGELSLLVTANTVAEMASALRLQQEFGFDLVLDSAAESYLLLDEIREAGVPVLLHPTMSRVRNGSYETAAQLADAGIPFAIQTGFEGYVPKTRVLIWEAAIAAANGLGMERALEAVTLSPARILGIDDRVGSIEVGKDADLALFDGDPFEYTSHICGVIIESEVMSAECR